LVKVWRIHSDLPNSSKFPLVKVSGFTVAIATEIAKRLPGRNAYYFFIMQMVFKTNSSVIAANCNWREHACIGNTYGHTDWLSLTGGTKMEVAQ